MNEWFKTSLGYSIINQEKEKCTRLVPSGYYARSLQIGMPWANYFEGIEVSSRFVIDTHYQAQLTNGQHEKSSGVRPRAIDPAVQNAHGKNEQCHYAVSASAALPFPEKTHDLVILPHTLDFCPDPHEVLRQTSQILVAEGCIVIIGFNLIGFYGMIKLFTHHKKDGHKKQAPWDNYDDSHADGHYYRVGRVQDWLALLGFDLVGAAMTCWQPPVQSEKWRDKLAFIEKAGERWWPGLGGVYVIVGRKREMAVTALSKSARTWHRLIPGMAQPISQRAARIGLKLVTKN